jgi:hypothetical protein
MNEVPRDNHKVWFALTADCHSTAKYKQRLSSFNDAVDKGANMAPNDGLLVCNGNGDSRILIHGLIPSVDRRN